MSWPYRNYSTYLGRWLQAEKLGMIPNDAHINPFGPHNQYEDGMNLYEYVKSQPTSARDPHALITVGCCKAALPTWLKKPTTKHLYGKAITKKDAKGKPCLKDIKCKKCSDKKLRGWYDRKKRRIYLCGHKGPSCNFYDWWRTLEHELIHAISLCGSSPKDCKACMIEEKRAYYLAFQCFSNWECTLKAWGSCTYGKKPKCDKKDKLSPYISVGWPPDPSVVF